MNQFSPQALNRYLLIKRLVVLLMGMEIAAAAEVQSEAPMVMGPILRLYWSEKNRGLFILKTLCH